MSSSSSPVRRRRPRRPPRGRNRSSRHGVTANLVRSVLVVTVVSSIAIGTYFAFSGDVLTRLIGRQQITYEDPMAELRARVDRIVQRQKILEQLTSKQTSDSSATGTIKSERITAPEATPVEKSAPASPTPIPFGEERETRLQSPELPASATTKHHRIYRAAYHRVSLRHRVAPPKAAPAEQSPQLTSATTNPHASIDGQ